MWFDPAVVEAVRDAFPTWTAFVFAFLSYLGSVWFVAPAVVLAYLFGDRHRFAPWLAIVIGSYAIMAGLKGYFQITRPGIGPAIEPEALPRRSNSPTRPSSRSGPPRFRAVTPSLGR